MKLTELSAISPIDGRYSKLVTELQEIFSEYALIKYRIFVRKTKYRNFERKTKNGISKFWAEKLNIEIFHGKTKHRNFQGKRNKEVLSEKNKFRIFTAEKWNFGILFDKMNFRSFELPNECSKKLITYHFELFLFANV